MKLKHDMKTILGEDFFKKEVRCDYLVSEEMKRIWAVLLDMYLAFAEVCNKYNLRHFAVGGTLLGAVRHNGFIPWDDDFDVGMPREDYNRFLEIASNDFVYPLFFQTPYTDLGYYVSWAKIRNSSTTGLSKVLSHRHFNQGLYLDIFPLDYFDPDLMEANREKIYICAKKCGAYMRDGSKYLNERQRQDAVNYHTDNPLKEWESLQEIASSNSCDSGNVGISVFTGYSLNRLVFPASGFDSYINHSFENIDIPIPCGWKEQLQIQFGNFNEYPPIKDRGIRHSDIIFDPDRPYTDYLE